MLGFFCALGVCLSLMCCLVFGRVVVQEVVRERREFRLRPPANAIESSAPIPIGAGDDGPSPRLPR
jgi:hypothetical protein